MLPDDYLKFVEEIGFPVIGFQYYCQSVFSFLPPEHRQTLSQYIFDGDGDIIEKAEDCVPRTRVSLFAAFDLSDIGGYAFARVKDGVRVYLVEDCRLVKSCGSFSDWLDAEIDRITEFIETLNDEDILDMFKENGGETDPHRALDYALYFDEPHDGFSDEDLQLHWVQDQSTTPYYSYGLVNEDLEWLIPLQRQFQYVAPFRNSRALVKESDERHFLDRSGIKVEDAPLPATEYGKNLLNSAGKKFALAGRADKMGLGNFTAHVERIGGVVKKNLNRNLDFIVLGDCECFPAVLETALNIADMYPVVLMKESDFIEQTGFVFSQF